MIGLPQNFQHTGHIGSSDFGSSDVRNKYYNIPIMEGRLHFALFTSLIGLPL